MYRIKIGSPFSVLQNLNANSRCFSVLFIFCLIFSLSVCSSPSGGGEKPELTGTVRVSNTSPAVGDTLEADYSGNGTGTATRQWLADGKPIANANGKTYTVTASARGKKLAVQVSYTDQVGSVSSEATAAVAKTMNPTLPETTDPTLPGSTNPILPGTTNPTLPGTTNLTSIDDISEFLREQTGKKDNPLPLKIAIDLGLPSDPESGWKDLITTLAAAGDYVSLDLSDCTMTGTIFNHNNKPGVPGMDRLVKIVLPDTVASIGDNAFNSCTSLTEVIIPNAISIGEGAFAMCKSLTEVNFPNVKSIGKNAFFACSSLTKANFPNVERVGEGAFHWCTLLTEVSIPESANVAPHAFMGCLSL